METTHRVLLMGDVLAIATACFRGGDEFFVSPGGSAYWEDGERADLCPWCAIVIGLSRWKSAGIDPRHSLTVNHKEGACRNDG